MAVLPFNFFDLLLAAVLIFGAIRGRKHGISQEGLRVVKWLVLVVVCAAVYGPVGDFISSAGFFDSLSAFLLAYLGVGLVVFLLLTMIERRITPKLQGTDAFGRTEYYLGIGAGTIRYACMFLIGLSLLNAREFSSAEVKAIEKAQMDAYGSAIFPTLRGAQAAVFEHSLTGPPIKHYLAFLLIQPTPSGRIVERDPNFFSRLVSAK